MWAARSGREHAVERLMAGGADIDASAEGGATAASLARQAGHEQIVELLRAAGATH